VRRAILIGEDREKIRTAFEATGMSADSADSLEDAVRRAREAARVGDVVLLSPACASFDMFRNYEHRGDVFKAVVRALLG
jgi:UDP-N-acetylmuramoylalanine--D-glutamate ligase